MRPPLQPKPVRARQPRRWLPFGLALAVVTTLLLIPKPEDLNPGLDLSDTWLHRLAYGLLALTASYARPPALLVAVLLALHGALTEWAQGFVPGRTPSWSDWKADVTGTLVVLLAVGVLRRLGKRR